MERLESRALIVRETRVAEPALGDERFGGLEVSGGRVHGHVSGLDVHL
jgi:hypothetical protein